MKSIKTLFTSLLLVLMVAVSCDDLITRPQYVEPTADRQGLTSLTAIFTSGPYEDQEICRLEIEDDNIDRFVIPIPFYYPETSDDQTLTYMTSIRVKAELQPNYRITPALGVLDLTDDNEFTLTDPHGNSRKIIITGERVKSAACEIVSFVLDNPTVSGIIDKEKHTILLPTRDNVSSCTATVQVSAHASISPDPTSAHDYSGEMKFTVTAHDGKTSQEYVLYTGDPEKLDSGIDTKSVELRFNIDPVSFLGLPPYTTLCYPSLAVNNGNVVFCSGIDNAPVVINGISGTKIGTMKTAGADVAAITNDESDNILITNFAQGGAEAQEVNLYLTSSYDKDPVKFYSFTNPITCPVGHKIKVIGNLKAEAVIILTGEGIDGVTGCGETVVLTVSGGEVAKVETYDFYNGNGLAWGSAPVNVATVVPASLDYAKDGFFLDYYEGGTQELDMLHRIKTDYSNTNITSYGGDLAWGLNANCLDTKQFNGCTYMTVFVVSHFPQWGIGPQVYFYEITDPSDPQLLFNNDAVKWFQQGAAGVAGGDVAMGLSSDGYYLYMYYYDLNSQAIGGYRVDCIKRQ